MFMHLYAYVYTPVYVYIYTIYIYIHTHIYIYSTLDEVACRPYSFACVLLSLLAESSSHNTGRTGCSAGTLSYQGRNLNASVGVSGVGGLGVEVWLSTEVLHLRYIS